MDKIIEILESGSSQEKIKVLENLSDTDDYEVIQKMIDCLDDDDIKVRGEAFSSLILNKNKITNYLIERLDDSQKNIRGFGSLVLANRGDTSAIPAIMKLTRDDRSMVRSCALGALGHLKAKQAKDTVHNCILDENLEVRKSALQAMIALEEKISENEINEISKQKDAEVDQLIIKLKNGGPEGI
ncbi:MAG: HEAT repeat domain-containing protein [Nitrosopumilaceae archaeon]|nr:HEAT repeat domain-containing protein [Nitrosopumilaceae archaeon]